MMALLSVDILPDPPTSLAMSGPASVNIPPDPSWHCSERYFATLLARYDAMSSDELAMLDALINRDLVATRPHEISVAFKDNVNRTISGQQWAQFREGFGGLLHDSLAFSALL
ncbi:hypothetical protein I4F81_007019 [Pyropia yezoensis]|uniref:Uncharacterized protein n=1 Tax=Pyropia yezoensis TaxID=2788 RepID=A0ACC3C2Z9_PYRYE|nr:hypothetical protein I4F81_007019 [Neopyropia yezoensis]